MRAGAVRGKPLAVNSDDAPASPDPAARPLERAAAAHVRRASFLAAGIALAYAFCGIERYRTYTNGTFDLAFYARMAWGMARFDFWDPILGAHDFGLHLSPVLVPVGWLGTLVPTPIALYLAQGLAVALAAVPLARIGVRSFGAVGAYAAAFALVLHPNVGHVLAYEAHPGTLAVLPLAWLVEAVDRRSARTFVVASLGVLACREDLALIVVLAALVALVQDRGRVDARGMRRAALASLVVALAWLGVFVGVLHPMYRPAVGSMEAHFGGWGRTSGQIVHTFVFEPGRVLAHLGATKRLSYLPRVFAPLLLLPFFSPRALVIASPVLGVALLSFFVTTTRIDSHYLTPAIPILVFGALDAGRRLTARRPALGRCVALGLGIASILGTLGAGLFSPLRRPPAFVTPPVDPRALDRLVAAIPRTSSVEAPDAILPHVSERRVLHRATTFIHDDDALVLDLSHRARFAHREDLLRTTEEPRFRALFAHADRRVVATAGPYVLLLRATDDPGARIDPVRLRSERAGSLEGVPLTSCLSLLRARILNGELALDFEAHGACPSDLAIRLGREPIPRRVDLLFGGLVSPANLRPGDVVRSFHDASGLGDAIHVGALRSSGARPDPADPISVEVPVLR